MKETLYDFAGQNVPIQLLYRDFFLVILGPL